MWDDGPSEGTFIGPDNFRETYNEKLSEFSLDTLLSIVKEYEAWLGHSCIDYLHNTISREIRKDGSGHKLDLWEENLKIYDAVSREIARRWNRGKLNL